MKQTGPYLTLVGGLAAAGALFALSTHAVDTDQKKKANQAAALAAITLPDQNALTPKPAAPKPSESSTPEPSTPAVSIVEVVPPGTYAGSVKGGGTSIAVVVTDGTAVAYVCDGRTVEAWMQGPANATAMKLTGKNKATLNATHAGGRLAGTVKAGGKKWAFSVKAVKAPSGLYRSARTVRKASVVGGWIVVDGKQVGMVSSSTDGQSPAPSLDLASSTAVVDGVEVTAALVDGSTVD
jgi:hypothetical protein